MSQESDAACAQVGSFELMPTVASWHFGPAFDKTDNSACAQAFDAEDALISHLIHVYDGRTDEGCGICATRGQGS